MAMKNMAKINISLPKEELKKFKALADKEHRPYNKQFLHMMDFYIKNQKGT